jgi:hypothetical protein
MLSVPSERTGKKSHGVETRPGATEHVEALFFRRNLATADDLW